jgi:regulator of RNase E activity RraA
MNENFTIHPVTAAPSADLLEALQDIATSHISDNQRRLEGILGLRRIHRSSKLVGTAVTVKLSMMSPGHVLVVDAGGVTSNAIVGDLLMSYAQQRGCAGFVVDGAVRDSAAFVAADFPCYARDVTHRGPFKTGPGCINVPVSIGGQVVQPGDVIVGDEDGLVVFPASEAERLVAAAKRSAAAEAAIRKEVLTGNVRQSWMDKMFEAHGIAD